MIDCDILVVGSGIAGLSYALDVAEHAVVYLICKKESSDTNTAFAQGGVASVTSVQDSFASHIEDTMSAGAYLSHREVVEQVVQNGPQCIKTLVQRGACFDLGQNKEFALAKEGGHSERRILHSGDATGREIQQALLDRALAHPNITIAENRIAIDLITQRTPLGNREVLGAHVLATQKDEVEVVRARLTCLASGGIGKIYLYTSNSDVATGDGIAMAYRAGAAIANMEFVQFHPTCLFHPKAKSFLITEAMRGEGAILLNSEGQRFMESYHPSMELAPRDIVARAIDTEMKRSGEDCVYLDISFRDKDFINKRFPQISARTLELGIDITKEPIPVVPAAHYCCGGVLTDHLARSSLERLYVVGESACTGLHGANRLASNSLLEALVFSKYASDDSISKLPSIPDGPVLAEWNHLDTTQSPEEVLISHVWDEVRRTMWNLVGIVRSDKRLALAERRLANLEQEIADYYWNYRISSNLLELRNIIQVAQIVIASARHRRESRGLHFNIDCPNTDDRNWKRDTVLKRQKSLSDASRMKFCDDSSI